MQTAESLNGVGLAKRYPRQVAIFLTLFCLVFLVGGGWATIWGWEYVKHMKESTSWPTVEGRVISRELSSSSRSKGGSWYRPSIVYRYSVEGETFDGWRIGWDTGEYPYSIQAERVLKPYPVGATVEVHYDPASPSCGVLNPAAPENWFHLNMVWLIGAGMFLFGALVSALGIRSLVKARAGRNIYR